MPGKDRPGLRWITSSSRIKAIRRAGRPLRGKLVFVWASLEAPGEAQPAVAVVTGRGFRGAVSRNLAKRRLRSGILERRDLLDQGYEYLVEGRPGVEKADYQILVNEIEDLLSRTRNCVKQKRREPCEE